MVERLGGAGVPEDRVSFQREDSRLPVAGAPCSEFLALFKDYDGPTMNGLWQAAAAKSAPRPSGTRAGAVQRAQPGRRQHGDVPARDGSPSAAARRERCSSQASITASSTASALPCRVSAAALGEALENLGNQCSSRSRASNDVRMTTCSASSRRATTRRSRQRRLAQTVAPALGDAVEARGQLGDAVERTGGQLGRVRRLRSRPSSPCRPPAGGSWASCRARDSCSRKLTGPEVVPEGRIRSCCRSCARQARYVLIRSPPCRFSSRLAATTPAAAVALHLLMPVGGLQLHTAAEAGTGEGVRHGDPFPWGGVAHRRHRTRPDTPSVSARPVPQTWPHPNCPTSGARKCAILSNWGPSKRQHGDAVRRVPA